MNSILISAVGHNDENLLHKPFGAIATALIQKSYQKTYLVCTNQEMSEIANKIIKKFHKNKPEIIFEKICLNVSDPTDYNLVYPLLFSCLKEIREKNKKAEFTINVTSGTSVIHNCWIFLTFGKVIDARLIQISREQGVKTIDFSLDDFPDLSNQNTIKAKLTFLNRENHRLKKMINYNTRLIGESEKIQKIIAQLKILANYDIPVLIKGASGSGKELAAEEIHSSGKFKDKPFVKVNCGAISENLFESEFFGYKKGAFTGALHDTQGKFKEADGGTIFLDEIADLPLHMQVKLLRVLNDGCFSPVGSNQEVKVNVRLITATNKDIVSMVREGTFRKDLYYRIASDTIEMPSLKERKNDIFLLADFFINKFNNKYCKNKLLSNNAFKLLQSHSWPGNVRELYSVLERAYIYSGNIINDDNILLDKMLDDNIEYILPDTGIDLDGEVIPAIYKQALEKTNGNKKEAAKLLNIPEKTFLYRLKSKKIN